MQMKSHVNKLYQVLKQGILWGEIYYQRFLDFYKENLVIIRRFLSILNLISIPLGTEHLEGVINTIDEMIENSSNSHFP